MQNIVFTGVRPQLVRKLHFSNTTRSEAEHRCFRLSEDLFSDGFPNGSMAIGQVDFASFNLSVEDKGKARPSYCRCWVEVCRDEQLSRSTNVLFVINGGWQSSL